MVRVLAIGVLSVGVGFLLGACGDDDDVTPAGQLAGAAGAAAGAGGGGGGAGAAGATSGAGGAAAGSGGQAGATPDAKWACLGRPTPRPSGEPVDFVFRVARGTSNDAAVDALVRACERLDTACTAPVVAEAAVSAEGAITMQLPSSFDGFVEVRSKPDAAQPFVTLVAFLSARDAERGVMSRRVSVFTEAELSALAGLVGGSYEPGTPANAALLATALDCEGAPAEGVSFRVEGGQSPRTQSFYTDRANVVSTALTQTSAAGTFGMVNLTSGALSLTATLNPRQVVRAALPAFVRDGQLTQVFVGPE